MDNKIDIKDMKILEQYEDKDVELFNFAGEYDAKVVDVHDGDTCRVIFIKNNTPIKLNIRMLDYDAPELRGDTHALGIEARDYLRTLILKKIVKLQIDKFDKYGRSLGKIMLDGRNINQEMAHKYGVYGRKEYLKLSD